MLETNADYSAQYLLVRAPTGLTAKELRQFLKTWDYYVKANATAGRLEQLSNRCERGLLSYEKYTIAELRGFAAAR